MEGSDLTMLRMRDNTGGARLARVREAGTRNTMSRRPSKQTNRVKDRDNERKQRDNKTSK